MKVYMDYNATTPVDPRIAEVAIPFLKKDSFGNPSSFHSYGRYTREAISTARDQVAACLKTSPENIVFTGSGSEGDNHAIKGAFFSKANKGRHIITSQVEHPAVIGTCRWLEEHAGARVTYLPVDAKGRLFAQQVADAIEDDTVLVTIMAANNEIGVVYPIREIAEICRARGVLMHSDGVQALGKIRIDVTDLGVDIFSFAGHKVYAPKGVGGNYIRPGVIIDNLLHGGHQERGLRAGTENVLGIVAMGKACELICSDFEKEVPRMTELRNRLENELMAKIPELSINGHCDNRVCNTSNITFKYIEGEALLLSLDMQGIAVSSGSACSSGSEDPSPVLSAIGLKPEDARATLRFSLGRFTTTEDVDLVIEKLPPIVERLRAMSPIYPGKR